MEKFLGVESRGQAANGHKDLEERSGEWTHHKGKAVQPQVHSKKLQKVHFVHSYKSSDNQFYFG